MKSKFLPIILIVAVLLVAGCTQGGKQATPTPNAPSPQAPAQSNPTAPVASPSAQVTLQPLPVNPSSQATTEPTTASSVKTFTNDITHGGYAFKDSAGASVTALKVNKGDTVKILATSTPASHKHGIAIDAYNINIEVTGAPSSPQEITFKADKAGNFDIYCKSCLDGAVGAHPQLKAALTVE